MSEIWSIAQLQRLCELTKVERAKKDKSLKRPGVEAEIEEKYNYLEKIYYIKLLDVEVLVRAMERLEKLCSSGSDARNKYGEDLELLRKGINALRGGGIEAEPSELEHLKNEAETDLNALQAGYPQASGKELLAIMEGDKNQEKYFYILKAAELLEAAGNAAGDPGIFSKEYIENVRTLYSKNENNYQSVLENIEKIIREEKGVSAGLKDERSFAAFLEAFESYKEVEQGKQRLNKENCSEFLCEMEKQLLVPIQKAKSKSSLKREMILAFRYPECLERFCSLRNLEQLNQTIEYKREIADQLIVQMRQQSSGITRQIIFQIAAGLNIKLAEVDTNSTQQEERDSEFREKSRKNDPNLVLVHTYIMKEMPAYIQMIQSYYNAIKKMMQECVYKDYVSNLQELENLQDGFWSRYNQWQEHRKLLADIDLSENEEAMRRMTEGDQQMLQMAESVKKNGALMEQSFHDFLSPKYEKLKEYNKKVEKKISEISEHMAVFKGSDEYLSVKEKKIKEQELRQHGEELNLLLEEMQKEDMEWKKAGEAANTLRKNLEELIEKARTWQQDAISQVEQNTDKRFFVKAALFLAIAVVVMVMVWQMRTGMSLFPKKESYQYNSIVTDSSMLEQQALDFTDKKI